MSQFLKKPLTSAAICWRLERRDGIALGFTGHDRDLYLDGLVHRAAPGMLPSAISLSDGFDPGGLDVAGALTSDAISEADLAAGRWDGAALSIFMTDWETGAETLFLARGELGEIAYSGAGFEAELRASAAALERPVTEQTSPECRASLGDERCRVDMAARTIFTHVAAVVAEDVVEVAEASGQANAHAYGRLRWLTGPNSGLASPLIASAGNRLTLREPPHYAASPGELVEVMEGCDKAFATCRDRFANGDNFRGEPHLPGIDLLTRYPGA
ncbi:MAG: DUF2163 domain-containing protein [Sphingomonadaceae bacterium]